MQAMPQMFDMDRVLILYGDVPLTEPGTLRRLIDEASETDLGVLTAMLSDPTGYGRIVRDRDGRVLRSVEQKDATEAELEIDEVNTGFMIADRASLEAWLSRIGNDNAQGEYYLTDVIAIAAADGVQIATCHPDTLEEVSRRQRPHSACGLGALLPASTCTEADARGRNPRRPGSFRRPRTDLRRNGCQHRRKCSYGRASCGSETACRSDPTACSKDCEIGADTQVFANCVIENAGVGSNARIGPYSRLRPDALLSDDVHVGNFVEIKKSRIGTGSKVNHLTYVGDAKIGSGVNVGAGTITCNYDGANKHLTTIGDDAFIGSNASLVAPVDIGAGATIGAGSVISREAPGGKLTVTRAKQVTFDDWQRPCKKPKA